MNDMPTATIKEMNQRRFIEYLPHAELPFRSNAANRGEEVQENAKDVQTCGM
ncbi:hypothetical protein [Mycolicibacterium madagascariense]|uniref:hypothetical protein n=1 Tax=Mycolicibacterium madagascariense TaxID=212765 RepID=UPI0013D15AE2|nr:hypothetical protein [Mycolicibacterium madagascariense]MCV7012377.1 hypothetical protein [Mycolicibacterium madagascariense]